MHIGKAIAIALAVVVILGAFMVLLPGLGGNAPAPVPSSEDSREHPGEMTEPADSDPDNGSVEEETPAL